LRLDNTDRPQIPGILAADAAAGWNKFLPQMGHRLAQINSFNAFSLNAFLY
jgi:hypothetical protein